MKNILICCFSILAVVIHRDYHVLVGTHKEIISFQLLGVFKTDLLKIVVFDDADMTASTVLMKDRIIKRLPSTCQTVFASSTPMIPNLPDNVVEMKLFIGDEVFPHGSIDNYCAEFTNIQKYNVLKALAGAAARDGTCGKIVIFFTVSLYFNF